MNKLSLERKAQIIKVLCEGNSIRSTARITDTAINTVIKLLREVGAACMDYQDKTMRNLNCSKLQIDEIWSFCYSKADCFLQVGIPHFCKIFSPAPVGKIKLT